MNEYEIVVQIDGSHETHYVEGTHYRKTADDNIIVFNDELDDPYVTEIDSEHLVMISK